MLTTTRCADRVEHLDEVDRRRPPLGRELGSEDVDRDCAAAVAEPQNHRSGQRDRQRSAGGQSHRPDAEERTAGNEDDTPAVEVAQPPTEKLGKQTSAEDGHEYPAEIA
jgi:hypothetical protein